MKAIQTTSASPADIVVTATLAASQQSLNWTMSNSPNVLRSRAQLAARMVMVMLSASSLVTNRLKRAPAPTSLCIARYALGPNVCGNTIGDRTYNPLTLTYNFNEAEWCNYESFLVPGNEKAAVISKGK